MTALAAVAAIAVAVLAYVLLAGDDDPDAMPDAQPRPAPPSVVAGSVMQPTSGAPVTFDADACRGSCAAVDDGVAWEIKGASALVLRRDGEAWRPILEAGDVGDQRFQSIKARQADLTGDGRAEVVFGFRARGSGGILQVDVVSSDGDVVLHRDLDKGEATVDGNALATWEARFLPEDPNCCPSGYVHTVIRFEGGHWREVKREDVAALPPLEDRL